MPSGGSRRPQTGDVLGLPPFVSMTVREVDAMSPEDERRHIRRLVREENVGIIRMPETMSLPPGNGYRAMSLEAACRREAARHPERFQITFGFGLLLAVVVTTTCFAFILFSMN